MIKLVITLLLLAVFYCLYQLLRNQEVFRIRTEWTYERSELWHKYTYDEMMNPSRKNWYGFKYPNEKDFK